MLCGRRVDEMTVNHARDSRCGGMAFIAGVLMRIKLFLGSEMIYVAGCNNTLNYFPYERNEDYRDWTV